MGNTRYKVLSYVSWFVFLALNSAFISIQAIKPSISQDSANIITIFLVVLTVFSLLAFLAILIRYKEYVSIENIFLTKKT